MVNAKHSPQCQNQQDWKLLWTANKSEQCSVLRTTIEYLQKREEKKLF